MEDYDDPIELLSLGKQLRFTSELDESRRYLIEAREAFASIGNEARIIECMENLAFISLQKGDIEEAERIFGECHVLSDEIQSDSCRSASLVGLAVCRAQKREYSKAIDICRRSLKLARRTSDKLQESRVLNVLAVIEASKGDFTESEKILKESLDMRKEAGDRRGYSRVLSNLGHCLILLGDYDGAEPKILKSIEVSKQEDDEKTTALGFFHLGILEKNKGNYEDSKEKYEVALRICRSINWRSRESMVLKHLAGLEESLGNLTASRGFEKLYSDIDSEIGFEPHDWNNWKEEV